jgi:tetratricopeptide (TPR) repeat protein
LKQYAEAIEDYTKAIDVNAAVWNSVDDIADYYYNRGVAYNFTEEYRKALTDLKQSTLYSPHVSIDVTCQLALANAGIHELREAMDECKR